MKNLYILEGKNPVQVDSTEEWLIKFSEIENRVVKQDQIDKYWVSTVFLGIDHSFGEGPPVLFETMVFSKNDDHYDQYQERYSTWDEALSGHERICNLVQSK